MDRVFLDANVLFSAAYREGAGLQQFWQIKDTVLLASPYAIQEARSNLRDSAQIERLELLCQEIQIAPDVPVDRPLPEDVSLPEKDRPILLCAIENEATHLVTGDLRDFGQYFGRRISGVLIVTPAQYLESRQ